MTKKRNADGLVSPKLTGKLEFETKLENGKCCVRVKQAPYLDIYVRVVLPKNWGEPTAFFGGFTAMTKQGYLDTVAHEFRRRQAYRDANKVYLNPAEGKGDVITKCGWICRDSIEELEEVKNKLTTYVSRTQKEALAEYDSWIAIQQNAIGKEDNPNSWRTEQWTFILNGKKVTKDVDVNYGHLKPHTWVAPQMNWTEPCPK